MINDPKTRLPYKDDNDDDLYIANPEDPKEEENLEDEVEESEEQAEK